MDTHSITVDLPGTKEDLTDDIKHLFLLSQYSDGSVVVLPTNQAIHASYDEIEFLLRHLCENILSDIEISDEFHSLVEEKKQSLKNQT
jgi:hypothetical protein